jgi:hypothetical protein
VLHSDALIEIRLNNGKPGLQHQLTPPVDLRIRVAVLVVLLIPVYFAPDLSLKWRVLACFMPMVLSGTFRISTIRGDWLTTRLFLGFVRVRRHKCKLAAVAHVATKYGGSAPGFGTYILFGPIQWLMGYVFDFLIPAIGGPYELWLETSKGREFIVWQGFSQHHFEKNLELLQNQTGATIRPK